MELVQLNLCDFFVCGARRLYRSPFAPIFFSIFFHSLSLLIFKLLMTTLDSEWFRKYFILHLKWMGCFLLPLLLLRFDSHSLTVRRLDFFHLVFSISLYLFSIRSFLIFFLAGWMTDLFLDVTDTAPRLNNKKNGREGVFRFAILSTFAVTFFSLLFVISQMQKSAKQFAVSKQGGSGRERARCTIAIYGYRIHVSEMSFWRIYTAETKMRERQRMEVEMRPHLYWMWIEWKRSEHRTQQKKMYRFRRRVEM